MSGSRWRLDENLPLSVVADVGVGAFGKRTTANGSWLGEGFSDGDRDPGLALPKQDEFLANRCRFRQMVQVRLGLFDGMNNGHQQFGRRRPAFVAFL